MSLKRQNIEIIPGYLFFRKPPVLQISTFSLGQKGCAYYEKSAYYERAQYFKTKKFFKQEKYIKLYFSETKRVFKMQLMRLLLNLAESTFGKKK